MSSTVAAWLDAWEAAISRRDYDQASTLFDPEVIAFGTYTDHLKNRDQLIALQWQEIWPHIKNFQFSRGEMTTIEEGSLAIVLCPWTSIGIASDGSEFSRAGRATLVLRRTGQEFLAVHTHLSLSKGSVVRMPID